MDDGLHLPALLGPVSFSCVLDAFSRRIVGWYFASRMRTDLVPDELWMAFWHRTSGLDVE